VRWEKAKCGRPSTAEGYIGHSETKVPGVWWVEHRDRHGELMAELIEVTRMPQILMTASEEIATGARLLREQIRAPTVARRPLTV